MEYIYGIDHLRLLRIRSSELSYVARLADRCYLSDLQRKGESLRATVDGDLQHTVWHYFLHVFLLRRDDHLPWHDHAYGGVCPGRMAQKSL